MEQKKALSLDYVFGILFVLSACQNMDHGAIPAALTDIQDELKLSAFQAGNFGSQVFLGTGIGAFLVSFVIGKVPYRYLLASSFIGNGTGILLFAFSEDYLTLSFARFCSGLFQSITLIYIPLFVDTHGEEKAPKWMSYVLLAPPLGVIIGYVLTATCLLNELLWRRSFQLQLVFQVICLATTLMLKTDLFEIGNFNKPQLKQIEEKQVSKLEAFKNLALNKSYVCYLFSQVGFYFILSGIQYWATNYMIVALKYGEKVTYIGFVIMCMTAPILGTVINGQIGSRFEGGWKNKNAQRILVMVGFVSVVVCTPMTFFDNYYICWILMWFLLFFGAMIVPGTIQTLLSCVEPDMRPQANSIAQVFYNIVGYLPAPILYGVVNTMTGGNESRYGMFMLMATSIPVSFLILQGSRNFVNRDHINSEDELQLHMDSESSRYSTSEQSMKVDKYKLQNEGV